MSSMRVRLLASAVASLFMTRTIRAQSAPAPAYELRVGWSRTVGVSPTSGDGREVELRGAPTLAIDGRVLRHGPFELLASGEYIIRRTVAFGAGRRTCYAECWSYTSEVTVLQLGASLRRDSLIAAIPTGYVAIGGGERLTIADPIAGCHGVLCPSTSPYTSTGFKPVGALAIGLQPFGAQLPLTTQLSATRYRIDGHRWDAELGVGFAF